MKTKAKVEIKCPQCESTNVYTLRDGTRICRKCGKTWTEEKKK